MRNIKIVYFKELLDTVRDRRTIISMIVVPIFVFPILTIGVSSFAANMVHKSRIEIHRVAVIGAENAPELYALVESSNEVRLTEANPDSLEYAINNRSLRAAMIIPAGFQDRIENQDSASLTLLYSAAETKSEFAADKLMKIIQAYEDNILGQRLRDRGMDASVIDPFTIERENVAKEKMGSFLLSMFIPYIIIILSMMGAMYTAIDLTAGEKERGTLETILVSPIPRWQLAAGKFLTILTTSVISTLLVLSSMLGTFYLGIMSAKAMDVFIGFTITLPMVLIVFLMMLPTAALLSSLLMSITLFAKSYKEAQSYASPLMFIIIIPAIVSLMPGVELDIKLAFVPLVNVCLSIREALMGNINWMYIMIIFISTVVYAAFAIFISHRLFEKESVLFRS